MSVGEIGTLHLVPLIVSSTVHFHLCRYNILSYIIIIIILFVLLSQNESGKYTKSIMAERCFIGYLSTLGSIMYLICLLYLKNWTYVVVCVCISLFLMHRHSFEWICTKFGMYHAYTLRVVMGDVSERHSSPRASAGRTIRMLLQISGWLWSDI